MKRLRMLYAVAGLAVFLTVAGTALASSQMAPGASDRASQRQGQRPPKPTTGVPATPHPQGGNPTTAKPETGNPHGDVPALSGQQPTTPRPQGGTPSVPRPEKSTPPAEPAIGTGAPPKPTQGQPSGAMPAAGQPSGVIPNLEPTSPRPGDDVIPDTHPADAPRHMATLAHPAQGNPNSPKPTTGSPSVPAPAEGRPSGSHPVESVPNGPQPTEGNPGSSQPAPAVDVQTPLLTITASQLSSLVAAGHTLTEVLQADRAAASGSGSVSQILRWHDQGMSWTEILQKGHKATAPDAARLQELLADSRNTQVRAAVEAVADLAGVSVDELLALMGDSYTLSDMQNAAHLAEATGHELTEVLALKTPALTWGDVAKQLKSTP